MASGEGRAQRGALDAFLRSERYGGVVVDGALLVGALAALALGR